MKKIILLLFIVPSISYGAAIFDITGCSPTVACKVLIDSVNLSLKDMDTLNLTQSFADAAVIAQRGLGADYSSNMTAVTIGGGIGLGASLGAGTSLLDLVKSSGGASNLPGVGFSSSLLVGINMSFLNSDFWKRTNLYFNMGILTPPSSVGIKGSFSSFGTHIQYQLIPSASIGLGAFGFGGVAITTGFEKSSSRLTVDYKINVTGLTALAVIGSDVKAYSIPIEISSNVKFLYFLTFFGGLGLDINWGTSKFISDLQNPVLSGGISGTPTLKLAADSSPETLTKRMFLGLQFDILAFKFFVQYNTNLGNSGAGLTLGTKIVW